MKKAVVSFLALLLLVSVALAAAAEEDWIEYCQKDGVKVYAEADTDSKVLKKLEAGDKVNVIDVTMNGKWYMISFKLKGKDKTGCVLSKYFKDHISPDKCTHNWSKWKVTEEPTCTEEGLKERTCSKCDLVQEKVIEKTEHEWGKWKVTEEPTCTEEGEKERTCKVCGRSQTKEVEMIPHKYGKWEITEEATCTEKGLRVRTCKVCDHEEEEEYLAPHEYGDWTVIREATCSKKGKREHTCENCGYVETQSIEKLPHDFKWSIIEKATDHSAGLRAKVCKVCGFSQDEVSYDPRGTLRRNDRGDAVCEIQQELVDQGYLTGGGADGVYGGSTERAIMLFQKDQGLSPDGVAWPQTQKRLKHNYGPWETVQPLTRNEPGIRTRTCKDCGYQQTETVEAGVTYVRRDRGEAIRTLQKLLNQLGYNAGSEDGIYGQKLDSAFSAFAQDHDMEFEVGTVQPADVDALFNAWFEAGEKKQWKGESKASSPVNLALTVTSDDAEPDADMHTYSWTLTNLGSKKCAFYALLLNYGDAPDFKSGDLVMVLDGFELKPNCLNNTSGTFSVAKEWGEGNLHFAALAVDESGKVKWLSNAVSFELAPSEAA